MAKIPCNLWVEKYRPKKVKDLVMPASFHKYFGKIVETKELPNLLLCSSTPGTGKTTIAKALVNDLGADHLYINASNDNGVDVLRTRISEFAMTKSFNKQLKVVILDEVDGTTPQFQAALRAFIEQFATSCRFIMTCNYITKIIPALQEGRTAVWDFNMSKVEFRSEMHEQMFKRVCGVLKFEGIEYEEEPLKQLVEAICPSMRKLLALLQKYADTYGKIDSGIIEFKNVGSELVDLLKTKKLTDARNYIQQQGYSYTDVFKNLFDNLVPVCKNKSQAILLLAQYEYQCGMSSMPDLQIAACLVELMGLL